MCSSDLGDEGPERGKSEGEDAVGGEDGGEADVLHEGYDGDGDLIIPMHGRGRVWHLDKPPVGDGVVAEDAQHEGEGGEEEGDPEEVTLWRYARTDDLPAALYLFFRILLSLPSRTK